MVRFVSVIIVTWKARDLLRQCLKSVERETKETHREIIVVDNASRDGTLEMIGNEFPNVRLIANEKNLGFARACNIGLKAVLAEKRADFILLLNADAILLDRAIEKMIAYLEERPAVAAVAPALVLPGGKFQTGAAGYLPSAAAGFYYFFFLSRIFPGRCKGLFLDQRSFTKRGAAVEVDWLSGACLLTRRDVVERIGLLDESYFFSVEDIDWGKRMKNSGFQLHYLPWVSVLHYHRAISKKYRTMFETRWLGFLYHFVKKERGRADYFLFRLFSTGGFFLRLVVSTFSSLFAKKREKGSVRELSAFLLASLGWPGQRDSAPKPKR